MKFIKAQARKNKAVNSVYFGRFVPKDGVHCFIPSNKFLEENALHYTEHDQYNLNPFADEVRS